MLLSIGPLRAQLKQRVIPLGRLALNECRYFHTTLPLNANKNNNPTSKNTKRKVTEKELMDRLTDRTKSKKTAALLSEEATRQAEEEPAVEEQAGELEVEVESKNEDAELLEAADAGDESYLSAKRLARLNKQMQDRVLSQALEKEKQSFVKKVQRKGQWDKEETRAALDAVQKSSVESQSATSDGTKIRSSKNNVDIAGLRNQKYKVGNQTLSIEDTDVTTLKRGKEKEIEDALSEYKVRARKEEEIVADNDPELISVLLDRPSQAERLVSNIKGEEFFEFSNADELAAAEKAKGGPLEEPTNSRELLARDRVRANTRGPAMRKNKDGEDELTLIYDDQPPANRFTLHFQDPIKKLKYFPIYPKKIKTWVHYMKDCKGRFNKWGYWKNDPLLQEEENELRDAIKAKARENGDSGLTAMVDRRKRQTLPLDLEGHYRFGVQPEELIGVHPKVKEMLSFRHANTSEIHAFRTKQLVKRWQERPEDHGTPQVQIACMTNRINYLSDHVKKHKKDHQCKLQLRLLISKRQSMLKYLRKKNVPIYYQMVRELDIQDISF